MTDRTHNAPSRPYDDPLYRECIPHRISLPDSCTSADGPTACFAVLEREREKWALVLEPVEPPYTDGAAA